MLILLLGIALLSMVDLYMTMTHLMGAGMIEGNPLARGIMAYNSPVILTIWKIATAGLAIGILFHARKRRSGELAAWVCCGLLVWLTVRWINYNAEIQALTPYLASIAEQENHRWVAIDPNS